MTAHLPAIDAPARPCDGDALLATAPILLPVFRGTPGLWCDVKSLKGVGALSIRVRLTATYFDSGSFGGSVEIDGELEDRDFVRRHGLPYTDRSFLETACAAVRDICLGDSPAPIFYTEAGMQSARAVSMEGGNALFRYLWEEPSSHRVMQAASASKALGGAFWRSRAGVFDTRSAEERMAHPR